MASFFRNLFKGKGDLKNDLTVSRTTAIARNPNDFTIEADSTARSFVRSETIPDTAVFQKRSGGLSSRASIKTGTRASILADIAEGDEDLIFEYSKLSIDPSTGLKELTSKITELVASKREVNIQKVTFKMAQAQSVSICFLLDTTGSMAAYIEGVKTQIKEIVSLVKRNGCNLEGVAFVGYKDWCDGKICCSEYDSVFIFLRSSHLTQFVLFSRG